MHCGHRPAPDGAWRTALGVPLAPLKSSALRDWETRVTGKGDVPCGAGAAEVGGIPPCLVELRVPAGSAEPRLRTQLRPRSIWLPFRHETQNMPPCWASAQPGLLQAPLTTPARTCGGRPHTASENSEVVQTRGWPAPGSGRVRLGLGDVREGFPAAGWPAAGGSALLDAGVRRAIWVRCSADVQFVRVVLGELHVRRHIGHAERLERGEELLSAPPVHMGLGLPHGHHVEPVLVRAGRPGEQTVDVLGRVVLGGDRAEAVDRYPWRRRDVDVCHVSPAFPGFVLAGRTLRESPDPAIRGITHWSTHSPAGLCTHRRLASCSPLAQAAIWLRLRSPSLIRMCWTWFSAVRSETYRVWPICLLVSPRATSRATSSSRGLRGESLGAAAVSWARSSSIRSVNGTIPSCSASRAAAASAASASSRSPGACRRVSAAASSTRACTAQPRAPLVSQIEAAVCRSSTAGSRWPSEAAACPSGSSTGPMYTPGPAPFATCWPRNGSNRAARNSMSSIRPRRMATASPCAQAAMRIAGTGVQDRTGPAWA